MIQSIETELSTPYSRKKFTFLSDLISSTEEAWISIKPRTDYDAVIVFSFF